jgi:transposase
MEASNHNPEDWRERRPLRAVRVNHQRDIAAALGVGEETVWRWLARTRDSEAKRAQAAPGRLPKRSSDQRGMILEFLRHLADAYGFRGETWTCARVANVIFV